MDHSPFALADSSADAVIESRTAHWITPTVVEDRPRYLPSMEHSRDSSGARDDDELVEIWRARSRSEHTRRAYLADATRFLAFLATLGATIRTTTVRDLQAFAADLATSGLAPGSQGRTIAAVKSLLSFAQRCGYSAFNVGSAVACPKAPDELAQRILSESEVIRLVLAASGRDRLLLRVLYASGVRVSELCGLSWCDVQPRDDGMGQITVYGKGSKSRAVLLPATIFGELWASRPEGALPTDPVFRSRAAHTTRDGAVSYRLGPNAALRVVKRAAKRAGIDRGRNARGRQIAPSPHWLRHAHVSHALDRHAPPHVVSTTVGHSSLAVTSRYAHARPSDSSALHLAAV